MAKDGPFSKIIGSVFAQLSPQQRWLRQEFRYLDAAIPGLGQKVVDYVETGEGRTVLATLANEGEAITRARAIAASKSASYVLRHSERGAAQRSYMLNNLHAETALIARYIEAFNLAGPDNSIIPHGFIGVFRPVMLFYWMIANDFSINPAVHQFTLDELLDVTARLDGRPADLINCAVQCTSGTAEGSLPCVNGATAFSRLMSLHDEFAEACDRLPVVNKAILIRKRAALDMPADPAFIAFLFDQAESGATKLRDAARDALRRSDPALVLPGAVKGLQSPKAATRLAIMQVLGAIATPHALAVLLAHRPSETVAANVFAIDQFLGLAAIEVASETAVGYVDLAGETVTLPPVRPLAAGPDRGLSPDALRELEELQEHERQRVDQANQRSVSQGWGGYLSKVIDFRGRILRMLELKTEDIISDKHNNSLGAPFERFLAKQLDNLAEPRAVRLALLQQYSLIGLFGYRDPIATWLWNKLESGEIDLLAIMDTARAMGLRLSQDANRNPLQATPEDLLRCCFIDHHGSRHVLVEDNAPILAPVIARHFTLLLDYLPPRSLSAIDNERALILLSMLPTPPRDMLLPLLAAAVGPGIKARQIAQRLLLPVANNRIDGQLIGFLADKRQVVRANAAALLGRRGIKTAEEPIHAGLKRESSDAARAAMIMALREMGADTSPYLGREALVANAAEHVASLPAKGLEWLDRQLAPALRWRDGTPAPAELAEGWLRLALKLKQPGGSDLFGLYLDQLAPADATAFCDWLLMSWIAYDTWQRPREDMLAEATAMAQRTKTNNRYFQDVPLERLVQDNLRNLQGIFPNSGAESRGVLALAARATPLRLAEAARRYIKDHGKRVSQSKALIDLLASVGALETVQVLVATATRCRQRSLREHAETLVQDLAAHRGWTPDELADRSVPSGGLDEGGVLPLSVGDDKTYVARLGSDLTLRLFNPDGKEVKTLPAGDDEATTEAKALLSTARKTVKTVVAQQTRRLAEAALASRLWTIDNWRADINAHPILARLAERIVWRGLDADGNCLATFRPTAEADLFDVAGNDAELSAVVLVDIAHKLLLPPVEAEAWTRHLTDFEVPELLPQFSRPILALPPELADATAIRDRAGWLSDTFTLRGAFTRRGYERGQPEDAGGFDYYQKTFASLNIVAMIYFTGSYVPEEQLPAALVKLCFVKGTQVRSGASAMLLTAVPRLILNECWNDFHDIAAICAYDPEWKQKGLGYDD
ncbi:MAG: DUF4132 domain-containing protein [Hyphomicrobiaceae bacterium]|nr:DUF4132 domain-containing protein [Hyphomicrobiaceae bacterium]